MIEMFEQDKATKKPKAKPKQQNPLLWLLGFKETEDERKAREASDAEEKRSREIIENAVRVGALPKVGKDGKPVKK